MTDYAGKILNALLDSWENSSLSRGENKVAVHIAFRFTKSSIPEYFDERSMAWEEIHACLQELEGRGFVQIVWKAKKQGHIIERVILCETAVPAVYAYLNRVPKAEQVRRQLELLDMLAGRYAGAPVTCALIAYLRQRLSDNLPVRELIDPADPESTARLVQAVAAVEQNRCPCYIREFSILHFGDSKAFEAIKGTVRKVFARFGDGFAHAGEKEIFAEYGIYQTPNYVYLKGEGILCPAAAETAGFPVSLLRQGLGLAGEDLETVRVCGTPAAKKVITIENLTAFFQWQEPESLIIYLGGYHNASRRRLLQMLSAQLPEARYLHSGDIDAGGFEIYEDLCRKTGIAFQPYYMGIAELQQYRAYAKPLTENDRRHLQSLLERAGETCLYAEVLQYMLQEGIKLEQECIRSPGAEYTVPDRK